MWTWGTAALRVGKEILILRTLRKTQGRLRKGLEEEKYPLPGKKQDDALSSQLKRGSGRGLENSIPETQDLESA